mmetsp:Transcript_136450/g.436642  ORF Transcript_136450/g.436642 Transcript_136450/m.436642 type:complete len:211 (+) Transcript_136450:480-1112(+)
MAAPTISVTDGMSTFPPFSLTSGMSTVAQLSHCGSSSSKPIGSSAVSSQPAASIAFSSSLFGTDKRQFTKSRRRVGTSTVNLSVEENGSCFSRKSLTCGCTHRRNAFFSMMKVSKLWPTGTPLHIAANAREPWTMSKSGDKASKMTLMEPNTLVILFVSVQDDDVSASSVFNVVSTIRDTSVCQSISLPCSALGSTSLGTVSSVWQRPRT